MYKPLTHGYKDATKWWAAVDLFRRVIIIFVIVVLPGRTVSQLKYTCPAVLVICSLARGEKYHCLIVFANDKNYIVESLKKTLV